jgi:hypothetical protein
MAYSSPMQPSRNLILASLPKAVYQKLLPSLTSVQLRDGDILYEAGRTIKFVYFPIASLVSFLSLVDRHLPLEVGLVGREGMVGAP